MRKIDRFDKYMKTKGLNDNKVTIELGLSVGTLGKSRKEGRDISDKNIEKILNFYTDINKVWLLTGEGEMLRNDSLSQITPQETNSDPTTITLSKDILEQVLLNLSETLKSQQEAILNQQITIQKFTTQSLTRQGASGAPEGNVTDASVSGSDLKK